MGAIKNSKFKVDNGTDFDTIHFETSSEQITDKIVSVDDLELVTEPGFLVDALVAKRINSNLTALNNNLGYELGSSGYTYYKKYNDGTLLMWGIVSIGYTTGSGTINFPIAFKDTLSYQLFVQQKYVSSAYVFEIISAQKMTGSLANVYSRKYPTTTDKVETHDADWFAVGRWK